MDCLVDSRVRYKHHSVRGIHGFDMHARDKMSVEPLQGVPSATLSVPSGMEELREEGPLRSTHKQNLRSFEVKICDGRPFESAHRFPFV